MIIYSIVQEIKQNVMQGQSLSEELSYRLKNDKRLNECLCEAMDNIKDQEIEKPITYKDIQQVSSAVPTMEGIREHVKKKRNETWSDLPQEEVAERLSKGEILPREEWIPGHGKERRVLNHNDTMAHLNFATRLHKEGNDAFLNSSYDIALLRYTQGVQLLNWVEGNNTEDTQALENMLLTFYKNQAAAALCVEDYRVAEEAATHGLKMDPHDAKSLYRRAEAYLCLGQISLAMKDYKSILRSPHADTNASQAARNGIRRIRCIVSKWKTDVKEFVPTAVKDDTFSEQRYHVQKEYQNYLRDIDGCQYPPKKESLKKKQDWEFFCRVICPLAILEDIATNPKIHVSCVSEEDVELILQSILKRYTEPDIQSIVQKMSKEADFEEPRIFIRVTPVLFLHLEKLLEPWENLGSTIEEKQRNLVQSIILYKGCPNIDFFIKNLYYCIIGDNAENL
ncbi:tetratricopeptide repeat protein 1-like isoform X2 [Hylaeus volcanicus]|nr:tetratricopeptide repeat protein 1-like isoform X2 [Hylaeus volcanicus]